jgi:large subunit ribosomal protein L9
MMEVILREDVKSLGKAGALVRVKPGYARNFLLPQGWPTRPTEGNKKRLGRESKARRPGRPTAGARPRAWPRRSAAVAITIHAKAGEGDRLFGSITAADIADELAQGGSIRWTSARSSWPIPIKQLGEHAVQIRLHSDVHATVTVTIVPA